MLGYGQDARGTPRRSDTVPPAFGIGISEAEDEGGDSAAARGGVASTREKEGKNITRKGAARPHSGAAEPQG